MNPAYSLINEKEINVRRMAQWKRDKGFGIAPVVDMTLLAVLLV
jgi:hypothetical protein